MINRPGRVPFAITSIACGALLAILVGSCAQPTAQPLASVIPASSTATPTPSASLPTASLVPEPTPTVAPTPVAKPSVIVERVPKVAEFKVAPGTEPSISADPFTGTLAVVEEHIANNAAPCSRPAVRFSRDGRSWTAPSYPWGRVCQDVHAVIAWGPSPANPMIERLWAADAVGVSGGVSISVTYSDNEGKTWAKPYIERRTRPWVGCYPAIGVDTSMGSPTFGAVFVAYNWLASSKGPGVSVIASVDGVHWAITQVPTVPQVKGYSNYNRIGYRISSVGGATWLSFYQADLRTYVAPGKRAIIGEGSRSNAGRRIVALTKLDLSVTPKSATNAVQTISLHSGMSEVTEMPVAAISSLGLDFWQTALAVDAAGLPWSVGSSGGKVLLAHMTSTTGGLTWDHWTFSVPGRSSSKPSVAVDNTGSVVFVGWHASSGGRYLSYFVISYDSGTTWTAPTLASKASWRDAGGYNGVGLRENATWANGSFYWAVGDNRTGTPTVYVEMVTP